MDGRPVGRDAEIAEILAFIPDAAGPPAALEITGDIGIGKTRVWRHVLHTADRSSRVLSCQPAPTERPLAFSALDDLFGDVAGEILSALPGPRRHAVEVALLRDPTPGAGPAQSNPVPDQRMLARGILDILRFLSAEAPLIVAVDDAQWLDRPSAGVLEFCLRRLRDEGIAILLTFRTDDTVPLGLSRALPPDRLHRVRLGPLSMGAIGEILRSRLGAVPPRYILTRLYDACGGNPFYALEYARAIAEHPGLPLTNEPIPAPHSLRDLVRRRLRRLEPDVRQVCRLVAASANPRERLIRAAHDDGESWTAIDHAVDAALIEREGGILRFTHPLLRNVLYSEMTLRERRQAHRRLGAATDDVEERAWHLALGADQPDQKIAGMLDSAAEHAALRGAQGASRPADTGSPVRAGAGADASCGRLSLPGRRHRPQPGTDGVRPPHLPRRTAARVSAAPAGHHLLPPKRLAAGRADVPPGCGRSAGRPGPLRIRPAGAGVRPAGGRRSARRLPAGGGLA
jgi:SAM-dependent methyltransferase